MGNKLAAGQKRLCPKCKDPWKPLGFFCTDSQVDATMEAAVIAQVTPKVYADNCLKKLYEARELIKRKGKKSNLSIKQFIPAEYLDNNTRFVTTGPKELSQWVGTRVRTAVGDGVIIGFCPTAHPVIWNCQYDDVRRRRIQPVFNIDELKAAAKEYAKGTDEIKRKSSVEKLTESVSIVTFTRGTQDRTSAWRAIADDHKGVKQRYQDFCKDNKLVGMLPDVVEKDRLAKLRERLHEEDLQSQLQDAEQRDKQLQIASEKTEDGLVELYCEEIEEDDALCVNGFELRVLSMVEKRPLFVYCSKEAGPECEKFEEGKSEKCASLPTCEELSDGLILGRVTNGTDEYYCKGILEGRQKRRRTAASAAGAAAASSGLIITCVSTDAGMRGRVLSGIKDLGNFASFLLTYTGKWVLCPQKLECWESKSLWFGILCLLCFMCLFLFVLVYLIGFDKNKAHGEERRRRCCCGHVLCILCDKLEVTCGGNAALAVFYLLVFASAGAVQVFMGYDVLLVLLFDAGIVLAMVFMGYVLRLFFPQLYEKQREEGASVGRP